jgi:hypothetical protein
MALLGLVKNSDPTYDYFSIGVQIAIRRRRRASDPDQSLAPKPATERDRGKHRFAPAASAVRYLTVP